MGKIWTRSARAAVGAVLLAGTGLAVGGVAAANTPPSDANCVVSNYSFAINGAPAPLSAAKKGDHIVVTFTIPAGCTNEMSFASYRAPTSTFSASTADQQVLFSSSTGTFGAGVHSLTVDVFGAPAGNASDCSVQHDNSNGGGANQSPGPYDPTCDGSASQNGQGNGNANGKPCAGCVGNADAKNPPGQYPNGNDPNAGYECDKNQGVGQTNPAHTGCGSFQVDFAYGPVIQHLGTDGFYAKGLIKAVNG
jgi:hypothetical protein